MPVSWGSPAVGLARTEDTAPELATLPEAPVPQTPADSVPPDGDHPLLMQELPR